MNMVECPSCNNEFDNTPKNGYQKKFCSRSCANRRRFSAASKSLKARRTKEHFESIPWEKEKARREKLSRVKKAAFRENALMKEFHELGEQGKRLRILYEQNNICSSCGIGENWNGAVLKFQLDHISGDRTDNSRDNLRLLCPNCHSQTPTYNRPKGITNAAIKAGVFKGLSNRQICLELGLNPSKNSYNRINKIRNKLSP